MVPLRSNSVRTCLMLRLYRLQLSHSIPPWRKVLSTGKLLGDIRGKFFSQNTQNLIFFISRQISEKISGVAVIIFEVRNFQRICESLGMVPDFFHFFAYLSQGLGHRYFSYLRHTNENYRLHSAGAKHRIRACSVLIQHQHI